MSTLTDTQTRLADYAREYARAVWPKLPYDEPGLDDLIVMEIRADEYANAHVQGEHRWNGLCSYATARECSERAAAAEYVETH